MAQEEHGLSRRRACRLVGISRSVVEREPKRARDHARLRERLHALAGERRRFGYRRLHELLRREGWRENHKLVERLYREEKLTIRRRGRQKRGLGGMPAGSWCPVAANQRWSLDFRPDGRASLPHGERGARDALPLPHLDLATPRIGLRQLPNQPTSAPDLHRVEPCLQLSVADRDQARDGMPDQLRVARIDARSLENPVGRVRQAHPPIGGLPGRIGDGPPESRRHAINH
jgi:HTH-like domain